MAAKSKRITRIDMRRMGENVAVSRWSEEWQEGSKPDDTELLKGVGIETILMKLEKEGFVCELFDQDHGTALRGSPTRIDFIHINGQWRVDKYPKGWTARTRPLSSEMKPADFDVEGAKKWCLQNGWTVHEWDGGARAWLGSPMPVRDAPSIRRMRSRIETSFVQGDLSGHRHYDLAFDL